MTHDFQMYAYGNLHLLCSDVLAFCQDNHCMVQAKE